MCNFRTSKLLLNCAAPEEGGPPAPTRPGGSTGMVLAPGAAPGAAGSGPELGHTGRQRWPHRNGDGGVAHSSTAPGQWGRGWWGGMGWV